MYEIASNGRVKLEADACGIGFLATRKGIPERKLVETALQLCRCFDHRGAPGHGAGIQMDIPWPLLLDRFSAHASLIAQRDVALGMFFLPYDASARRQCVNRVEQLAELAGAPVLGWADVPICPQALPPGSSALRTLPIVRQALFQRPAGLSEQGWFVCRYLLRIALDDQLTALGNDEFAVASLSNRTVVYKGLSELSRIGDLYPDLDDPRFASRFVLFHSRYCTNTTTAWRRAQPFWAIAHNGEISTISGNRAWMNAIGGDLINQLVTKFPELQAIAAKVKNIICVGGSDTANLDDMVIALIAGGLSLPQAILALLPSSEKVLSEDSPMHSFYEASKVYFGACDGPAAIVACDGDQAVAHLDRNGLRPMWLSASEDFVLVASELTGTLSIGKPQIQKLMGPGDTALLRLSDGDLLLEEEVHEEVVRKAFSSPKERIQAAPQKAEIAPRIDPAELLKLQIAAGMTEEDLNVLITPMATTGKPAIGSMGDDTSPAAMLDRLPRKLEDHFALRFAQETSPPIDPIRDAWVFSSATYLGDRRGPWFAASGPIYSMPSPILGDSEIEWLKTQPSVDVIDLGFPIADGTDGLERRLQELDEQVLTTSAHVIILTDRSVGLQTASVHPHRAISRVHRTLAATGRRNQVSLVADIAIWDIQPCALAVTFGADAVCPWLGLATAGEKVSTYLKGLRGGFIEAISMMGVTPTTAYCGAGLVEAIALDPEWVAEEFGVPCHLGGITKEVISGEWLEFHRLAFDPATEADLVDAGEFRHSKEGRRHANNAEIVRSLQAASGYQKKIHEAQPGSKEAYRNYSDLVTGRSPISILDLLEFRQSNPVPLSKVEPIEAIAWRFLAPGMSEGALSEPAHRAVARGLNIVSRYCRILAAAHQTELPGRLGPVANSGEGGFDKTRVGTWDFNRSVQYAGGRFTITPMTAANAEQAEVKFAQGAKPGKGGQLPGKKVSALVAQRRGCEPGFELVSPPINHNLYSIEDVKLMLESWRHLNPNVECGLKYVATYGVEMCAVGGVNAGANQLHISDGCGGTGAAKRVDQKHAGVPVAAVLPTVQDSLVEENVRELVEISVDGGIQNGVHALKCFLLGADRVGFGTSLLISIGCSMLRKCHLSGPDPSDPTGKRRLGCTPGIATQDPQWIARFAGDPKHVARMLWFVAEEVRELMAEHGIKRLSDVIGRRDLLQKKSGLEGKAALIDVSSIVRAPHAHVEERDFAAQSRVHLPHLRQDERSSAEAALKGERVLLTERVSNHDRCIGVGAAGILARAKGDLGIQSGAIRFKNQGSAGHFYAAYSVEGMAFDMTGTVADSCFTAAYGGELVVRSEDNQAGLAVVGNAFGYGARGGKAFIAGLAGNRFGICFRKNHEGGGPEVVVEGIEANGFQYMTGGVALVLGPTGFNLGSGMTGGVVYLYHGDEKMLNQLYVQALPLTSEDEAKVKELLAAHVEKTGSKTGEKLVARFNRSHYLKVVTRLMPESLV